MSKSRGKFIRPSNFSLIRVIIGFLTTTVILTANIFADGNLPVITPPPGNCKYLTKDKIASFPFEIFRGDIRFQGELNGQTVHMLLDDGFMWDPILFWGSPRIDSLGLEYDGNITIGDTDDENAIASRTASGITISFPGIEFTDQTAVITPYSSGTSNMWWGSEGQVSATFLKHCIVDINFDKMIITLSDPENFEYKGQGKEIPWTPMGFGPWQIPATLGLADGRSVPLNLLMDLGYNDQLQIAAGAEHKITVPEMALPTSLGFNIHREETRGFIGRLPYIDVGGYKIKDIIVGYVAEEHKDNNLHEVMIGLGLLSRFNLVFDYSRQRVFIEPNQSFAAPFEYDMSGWSTRKGPDGHFEIMKVHPDSPARQAGLLVGDKVTHFNGKPAADFDTFGLRPFLRQEGKTLNLRIIRGTKELEVTITLKRLI